MSITPDPTRDSRDSCCTKCGRLLLVNDQAITHDQMRNGETFVLGNCCTDLFIGALLQDFAALLKRQVFVGQLLNSSSAERLARIEKAANEISHQYQLQREFKYPSEKCNHEI